MNEPASARDGSSASPRRSCWQRVLHTLAVFGAPLAGWALAREVANWLTWHRLPGGYGTQFFALVWIGVFWIEALDSAPQ